MTAQLADITLFKARVQQAPEALRAFARLEGDIPSNVEHRGYRDKAVRTRFELFLEGWRAALKTTALPTAIDGDRYTENLHAILDRLP